MTEPTLMTLPPGQSATVRTVRSAGAVRQRLLDMGLTPGVTVSVQRLAPGGEPIWIELNGAQIALRRAEAEAIVVEL